MKTLLNYTLIFLLFLSSCKKEDTKREVMAGIYDLSFTYHESSPSLKVILKLDSLKNRYIGVDSLDINSDGKFDLFINQRIPLERINPNYYTIDNFPAFWINMKNGLEVATKIEYYGLGHGQYGNVTWIDTLNYKSRIDNIPDWSDTNVGHSMWSAPPTSWWGSYGCWYNLADAEKYIAIRIKIGSQYKYGWIKVNEISRENMQFLSYALEK